MRLPCPNRLWKPLRRRRVPDDKKCAVNRHFRAIRPADPWILLLGGGRPCSGNGHAEPKALALIPLSAPCVLQSEPLLAALEVPPSGGLVQLAELGQETGRKLSCSSRPAPNPPRVGRSRFVASRVNPGRSSSRCMRQDSPAQSLPSSPRPVHRGARSKDPVGLDDRLVPTGA